MVKQVIVGFVVWIVLNGILFLRAWNGGEMNPRRAAQTLIDMNVFVLAWAVVLLGVAYLGNRS